MPTGALSPIPRWLITDNGVFSPGAKLVTTLSGTSTPAPVYTNAALTVAHTNPVIADAEGVLPLLFLSAIAYRFEVLDSTGATIFGPMDNIYDFAQFAAATGMNTDVLGTAGVTLAVNDVVYLSDGSGALTAGRWYKTDADFTYASSLAPAVGVALAAITAGSTGMIRRAGRVTGLSGLAAGSTYYASATAGALTSSLPANGRVIGVADSTTSLILTSSAVPLSGVALGMAVELTIASGVVTVTRPNGFYRIDTEGDAASDDLTTITAGTGIVEGDLIELRAENVARVVTVKASGGNLLLAGDYALNATNRTLQLVYDGTNWRQTAQPGVQGVAVDGISVTGITFAATQVPSVGANVLDDYEEGTVTFTDASGAGLTFTTIEGYYIKIGQLVIVGGTLTYPSTADGSAGVIGGLPFTAQNSTNNLWTGAAINTSSADVSLRVIKNTTTAALIGPLNGNSITNSVMSTRPISFTVIYRATA